MTLSMGALGANKYSGKNQWLLAQYDGGEDVSEIQTSLREYYGGGSDFDQKNVCPRRKKKYYGWLKVLVA